MADILGGRFGRFAQALFNLNQPLTLGQVVPDVLSVVDLERPRPEMEIFSGNDLCAGLIRVPAVAAEFGHAVLQLPVDSGRVAILESFQVRPASGAQTFSLAIGAGTLGAAAPTAPQFLDTRRPSPGQPTCRLQVGSSAISLTTNGIFTQLVSGNILPTPYTIVLVNTAGSAAGTGRFVVVQLDTVNIAFDVSFRWRERALGAQEVQP